MTDRAAFAGSYADLKFVKTRSVFQVIVELPIEQADAFLAAFKAPQPGQERPVALALLHTSAPSVARPSVNAAAPAEVPQVRPEAEGRGRAASPQDRDVRMAGILCADRSFQEWLWRKTVPGPLPAWGPRRWEEETSAEVRRRCGDLVSRPEIGTLTSARVAWHALETAFRQATGQMAVDPRS